MFNSIALDVVIGLVFIYLLYSLFATVLSEIIATYLGLRARNLKEAVNRMLTDEKDFVKRDRMYENILPWIWDRLVRFADSLRFMKNPKNKVIRSFYNHPEIKYLGSSGIFKNPSSFKAVSFSKTLLNLILDGEPETKEKLDAKLAVTVEKKEEAEQTKNYALEEKFDEQTAKYITGLWQESYGDLAKFKLKLEGWFDRTMEQATEWYKRKIQVLLLGLGFFIAALFNADTLAIVKKLSRDKDARDKMVSMANAYVENNKTVFVASPNTVYSPKDSLGIIEANKKLDTLLKVKTKLEADIKEASDILGAGGWLPDRLKVNASLYDTLYQVRFSETDSVIARDKSGIPTIMYVSTSKKFCYLFHLISEHFFGFLITAIAISLGAPFWFDLLNKLMKLRTSEKQDTNSTEAEKGKVSPLDRVA